MIFKKTRTTVVGGKAAGGDYGSLPKRRIWECNMKNPDYNRSVNQEIMEFGGFGPSHHEIEILLNQNRSE